jgi:hypothetical protein
MWRWLLVAIVIGGWFGFGNPKNTVAGCFWGSDPAPWEVVDAFYYPDRHNLSQSQRAMDVGGLDQCRAWVSRMASRNGDPRVTRGDYECAFGFVEKLGDVSVYRQTAR